MLKYLSAPLALDHYQRSQGHHIGWWQRHSLGSAYLGGQQAADAGVRQADDSLSAQHLDAGWDS